MSFSRIQVYGTNGDDTLVGNTNDERFHAANGDDLVNAGDGSDVLYGQGGNDTLFGGDGQDFVWGGEGDDLINGGAGDDYLGGGAGNDTFIFNNGWGADEINNFVVGEDVIDFNVTGELNLIGIENVGSNGYGVELTFTDNNGEQSIVLKGYDVEDVNVADFFQGGDANWNGIIPLA